MEIHQHKNLICFVFQKPTPANQWRRFWVYFFCSCMSDSYQGYLACSIKLGVYKEGTQYASLFHTSQSWKKMEGIGDESVSCSILVVLYLLDISPTCIRIWLWDSKILSYFTWLRKPSPTMVKLNPEIQSRGIWLWLHFEIYVCMKGWWWGGVEIWLLFNMDWIEMISYFDWSRWCKESSLMDDDII